MRKLTGTSPFHSERVGLSCMARFFEADAAGVCVALILSVNQSAVSLDWFWAYRGVTCTYVLSVHHLSSV